VVPDLEKQRAMLGRLRRETYRLNNKYPMAFWPVPLPMPAPIDLDVSFRTAPPADASPGVVLSYLFGSGKSLGCGVDGSEVCAAPPADQMKCALRSVGTFPSMPQAPFVGVSASVAGAPPVREVRHIVNADATLYEEKAALGGAGFNVPSLLGVAAGGPYFHAGNARTLEEVFDSNFAGHYAVFGESPPSAEEIQALVSYLLSIDDTGDTVPPQLPTDLGFNPDLCAQFVP
jgi:hypothetical protein